MSRFHNIMLMITAATALQLSTPLRAGQASTPAPPGQTLQLQTADQQTFDVYAAGPEDARRGILLLHGWWGLDKNVTDWADGLAKAGFRVMAVDLYHRQVTTDPEQAKQLMHAVVQGEANAKYVAALKVLTAPNRKAAVMGRSFGGSQALYATQAAPDRVSATVLYYPYGSMPGDEALLRAIQGPVLGQFASDDFAFTPDKVDQFRTLMQRSGISLTVHMYAAKHGFDSFGGKNFNAEAHELARHRTEQFLNRHLQ